MFCVAFTMFAHIEVINYSVKKVALPRSAADIIFNQACFTTGSGNTVGESSIMSLPRRQLSRTGQSSWSGWWAG